MQELDDIIRQAEMIFHRGIKPDAEIAADIQWVENWGTNKHFTEDKIAHWIKRVRVSNIWAKTIGFQADNTASSRN